MSSLRDKVARAIGYTPSTDITVDDRREHYYALADAALAAIREQYAIVPREATYQMLDRLAYHLGCKVLEEAQMVSAYRAMIAVGEVK